jgi:hypothetical protein
MLKGITRMNNIPPLPYQPKGYFIQHSIRDNPGWVDLSWWISVHLWADNVYPVDKHIILLQKWINVWLTDGGLSRHSVQCLHHLVNLYFLIACLDTNEHVLLQAAAT